MRFVFLSLLIAACGTDTFEGSDAADDAAGDTGVTSNDATTGPDAAPFDPSQLASIALWLDAADAKTGDASDLVIDWPDHQHKHQTSVSIGVNSICTVGIHVTTRADLNNKPAVTFCNAILDVKDTNDLRLGTGPFYIAAVLSVPSSPIDHVLFTKTSTGQGQALPNGLTFLAPNASGRLQGWLNGNASAFSQNPLDTSWAFVAFVRTSTGEIYVRANGVPGTNVIVASTDDVSANGNDVGIGGYEFDQGDLRHVFTGVLAELVVVTGTDSIGLVEGYFKKKYAL